MLPPTSPDVIFVKNTKSVTCEGLYGLQLGILFVLWGFTIAQDGKTLIWDDDEEELIFNNFLQIIDTNPMIKAKERRWKYTAW